MAKKKANAIPAAAAPSDSDAAPTSTTSLDNATRFLALELRPASYIPTATLQLFSVLYAFFILPNPSSFLSAPASDSPSASFSINTLCRALIDDTVPAMLWILAGTLLVQSYFSISISNQTISAKAKKTTPQKPEMYRLAEALGTTGAFAVVLFSLIVALGAPLNRKVPQTALLAIYLSLLAFLPSTYILSSPLYQSQSLLAPAAEGQAESPAKRVANNVPLAQQSWKRIFLSLEPKNDLEISLLLTLYGTILGAFIGCLPIPLDWERPWQTWPITVLLGALGGWAAGLLGSVIVVILLGIAKGQRSRRFVDYTKVTGSAKDD